MQKLMVIDAERFNTNIINIVSKSKRYTIKGGYVIFDLSNPIAIDPNETFLLNIFCTRLAQIGYDSLLIDISNSL